MFKQGEIMWVILVQPKGKLTPDQVKFIHEWRGVVHIVRTPEDALKVIGVSQVMDIGKIPTK